MNRLIGIAGLVLALSTATAHGQVVLDLDPATGDQGVRERTVKPGEMVEVELLATGGAAGMNRFRNRGGLRFQTGDFQGIPGRRYDGRCTIDAAPRRSGERPRQHSHYGRS